MATTQIATIFLDRHLRVQCFTPAAQKIFNLLASDVGRSVADITHKLQYDGFIADLQRVRDGLGPIEKEVPADGAGWLLTRVDPYRAADDRTGGVVVTLIDITRRRQAEQDLRESEERFRQFAENSANALWIVNAETRELEYLSPAYERLWGEPRQAIMQNLDHFDEMLHPEDRERVTATLGRLFSGETLSRDYRIVRPDGSTRWIRDVGFPIRDEAGNVVRIAGIAQDITDEKERSGTLEAAQERFRLLVEGARDYAMFLLDPQNTITYWSQGAERVFGWTRGEALGLTGDLIFTPEDRAKGAVQHEMELALRDGAAPDRRWHLRKDGHRLWIDGVMRRLDDEHGNVRGFAKIARDATEQKEAEDALRHARDELEQRVVERTADLLASNDSLERAMAQRRQLEKDLLEISEREKRRIGEDLHDVICQELTATALFLKSYAKRLEGKEPSAAQTLTEAAQLVNRNVGIARDLARGLQPVALKAAGLTAALRELAANTSASHNLVCRLKTPKAIRLRDETLALNIYRIAQEAVRNATKHSGATEIVLCIEREADQFRLVVEDNGKGMRKRGSRKGLGLHIMRYRANVLGGTFHVEARKGGGTKIVCEVPVTR